MTLVESIVKLTELMSQFVQASQPSQSAQAAGMTQAEAQAFETIQADVATLQERVDGITNSLQSVVRAQEGLTNGMSQIGSAVGEIGGSLAGRIDKVSRDLEALSAAIGDTSQLQQVSS